MVPIFRSARLRREFETDGFVTTALLDDDELAPVTAHCASVAGEHATRSAHTGLYVSLIDEEKLPDDFTPLQSDELEAMCLRHGAGDNGMVIRA